jgi:hypothetical protein
MQTLWLVLFSKDELGGNPYAEALFEMSSLLPERYNPV